MRDRSRGSRGSAEGQEGAARVLSFCWTARLAGWPGSDASRARGPGSAARTGTPGRWGAWFAPWGWQWRGRGGVTSSLLQALEAQAGHAQSPTYRFLGGSARCTGGTVDLLAKDREAGLGLGWGEAAKRHPGPGGGGCLAGTVEWAVSQPQLTDLCGVPGPRQDAGEAHERVGITLTYTGLPAL